MAEPEKTLPELPRPGVTYADHSYPAYSKQQMVNFASAALTAERARADAAEQAGYERGVREAAEVIVEELLVEPEGEEDAAYDRAVKHCHGAVLALLTPRAARRDGGPHAMSSPDEALAPLTERQMANAEALMPTAPGSTFVISSAFVRRLIAMVRRTDADIALACEAAERRGIEAAATWIRTLDGDFVTEKLIEASHSQPLSWQEVLASAVIGALQRPPSRPLAALIAEAEARGVAREREACAKLVDERAAECFPSWTYPAHVLASAIRARATSGSGGEGGA